MKLLIKKSNSYFTSGIQLFDRIHLHSPDQSKNVHQQMIPGHSTITEVEVIGPRTMKLAKSTLAAYVAMHV